MKNLEVLKYWIEERHRILVKKLHGDKAPWSEDPIFQTTYFCNVRREDDKVTKFLRNDFFGYGIRIEHPMYEVNAVLSRFINWPDTIRKVGFFFEPDWLRLNRDLESIKGKVWGDAYIVSTNGRSMPKHMYLCDVLMPAVYEALGPSLDGAPVLHETLRESHRVLMRIFGLGSFMAAQVIADLKNTPRHMLNTAPDWGTWAAPGPGSLRGLEWLWGRKISPTEFLARLEDVRTELTNMGCELVKSICNQDLQNCLCEFDKYCRVKSGTGRSKRGYNGR